MFKGEKKVHSHAELPRKGNKGTLEKGSNARGDHEHETLRQLVELSTRKDEDPAVLLICAKEAIPQAEFLTELYSPWLFR